MCMQPSAVRPWQKWRWAGDELQHDTIVPAARKVPGGGPYDIDIREYLSIEGDAVVFRELHRRIEKLSPRAQATFAQTSAGSFDFRARCVRQWVGAVQYVSRGRVARDWLYPAETLAAGHGDCEDLALLTAALLNAAGISEYCIRVALGYLLEHRPGKKTIRHDHAWVMYLDEGGAWQVMEPLALKPGSREQRARGAASTESVDVEYVPYLVFNRHHLWRVRTPEAEQYPELGDYLSDRKHFWAAFDPTFATGVHNHIYDDALVGLDSNNLQAIKDASLWADVNVAAYDPRDHFDFAYIKEGWQVVAQRLQKPDVVQLAYALHSICDFYAHTLYAHLEADATMTRLPLFDPAHSPDFSAVQYDFSKWGGAPGCTVGRPEALWNGKLVSGQWWRWYTTYPKALETAKELGPRRCLPDHDALAVDSEQRESGHLLYTKDDVYKKQFELRSATATRHVRQAFQQWRTQHGDAGLWTP